MFRDTLICDVRVHYGGLHGDAVGTSMGSGRRLQACLFGVDDCDRAHGAHAQAVGLGAPEGPLASLQAQLLQCGYEKGHEARRSLNDASLEFSGKPLHGCMGACAAAARPVSSRHL
jgi:hypothetical protein